MKITETFVVDAPPEVVFDYLTEASNLAAWQTTKTYVEQLTDGPPALGTRVHERTKPPVGKEFDQIVEFTAFDRPRHVHVHVVEGPYPVDGSWTFEPNGDRTVVSFTAEGKLHGPMRWIEPIFRLVLARQFRGYHRNLQRNLASEPR